MKKTLITAGTALATIALSTLAFAGVSDARPTKADFDTLRTAIENNDYASLSDDLKTKITEAQFAKAVEKNTQKDAVEAAIEAGDYTAFRNAKIAEIPAEEEFQAMVAMHKAHSSAQAAIETAIKNNDFTAFKKAHTDLQTAMGSLKSDKPGFEQKTLSDTELQARFDKLVTQYKADGTLPKWPGKDGMGMGFGKWGMWGQGGSMERGNHKGRGNNQ